MNKLQDEFASDENEGRLCQTLCFKLNGYQQYQTITDELTLSELLILVLSDNKID